MEFFILPIISSTNDVIMASNYVYIVSIKLCLDGGHGNVMSSFGGCTTSGFDVIAEGGSRRASPVAVCKKKTWYDRVNS